MHQSLDMRGLTTEEMREAVAQIKDKIQTKMVKEGEAQWERAVWSAWQRYYLTTLYTPSGEIHETFVSMAIQTYRSPEEALHKIEEYHKKHPSSVGADAGKEFLTLYNRTRDAVAKREGISPMSGWIQTTREKRTGV